MARHENSRKRNGSMHPQRRWELSPGSRVWGYLRHSPGDNQTIDSQINGLQSWCMENNWNIERMFIDEGIEGSREDRDQFQQMIALARQDMKHVDGVVVWSFSRFARDQLDAQFYKAELRKKGYILVSKIDDIPSNELAPIYEAFIDWKNQRFLEDLSADVRRGLNYVVEKGYWPAGLPPIGFKKAPEEIGRRRNGEARIGYHLVKDESVAAMVALAWKMKIERNASYLEIHDATHLYKDPKHYSNFFDNLLYAGIFVYHGTRYPANWEEGGRFCEAYVTLEEFLQVQEGRKRRDPSVTPPRIMSSAYLLSGLLVCGVCAASGKRATLVGQRDVRKIDTRAYRCSTKMRTRGGTCTLPITPCWRLEDAVIGVLKELVLTPEYVFAEVKKANLILADADQMLKVQIPDAERFLREQQKRVESFLELIGKKGVTPMLEKQYDDANRRWLEASSRLASLKLQAARAQREQISVLEARQYLDEMLSTMNDGPIEERKALIGKFVDHIVVFPDHIEVTLCFRPDGMPTQFERALMAVDAIAAGAKDIKMDSAVVRSPGHVFSGCLHAGTPRRAVKRRTFGRQYKPDPTTIYTQWKKKAKAKYVFVGAKL